MLAVFFKQQLGLLGSLLPKNEVETPTDSKFLGKIKTASRIKSGFGTITFGISEEAVKKK
jgi:hypothetical protein